jgi:hypothetical protein
MTLDGRRRDGLSLDWGTSPANSQLQIRPRRNLPGETRPRFSSLTLIPTLETGLLE